MVPRLVTTLEALLGHITEHLLQLLGAGGRKEGAGKEDVRGFLQRNGSCMGNREIAAVERGRVHMCMRAREGHKGRGSLVRWRPLTDSNRLKMAHPHLLWPHTLFR